MTLCVVQMLIPRCLIVALSTLRRVQEGFNATVLEETSEAVFDATSCYFPVTFTPPPNDPHNISPDALKTGTPCLCVTITTDGYFAVMGRGLDDVT